MNFKTKTFATVAALAISSLGALAHADVTQRTSAQAVFTMDSLNTVNVNISATKYIPSVGNAQTSGSVIIIGTSGSVNANINARIADMSFSKVTINGTDYDQSHLTTQNFWFIDLKTYQRTQAFAKVDVTKMGKGMICFQVFAASDHRLLSQTCDSNGNLYNVPFISGSALLSAPIEAAK